VTADSGSLDATFPDWGTSPYRSVHLRATCSLADLLNHLYVLIPVLDNEKHYWVGRDELEKLLRKGEGWLKSHPEQELIARRYLRHKSSLVRIALERLSDDDSGDQDASDRAHADEEQTLERPIRLNDLRLDAVIQALLASGARRVVDLGCGEGRLLSRLLKEKQFEEIVGVDVSPRALEIAGRRLRLDEMAPRQRDRIKLLQGALTYRDKRLAGFDAAALVEVIEHLDPPRLDALERVIFDAMRPRTVIVTTPNREYNAKFEFLPAGALRHRDHRFEWTRAEFRAWADSTAARHGYGVDLNGIGEVDAELGPPTQMAVFTCA
jgi:3' terminal RNA ribose 2'-O-methyltransferase Hen1